MLNKFKSIIPAVMVGSLIFGSAALASDITSDTSSTLTSGALSITSPGAANFTSFQLTGQTETIETGFAGGMTVTDARGTAAGWKVTASASTVTMYDDTNAKTDKILSSGSLKLNLDTTSVAAAVGSDASDPTNIDFNTGTIDNGGTPLVAISAPQGSGMGSYDVSFGRTDALKLTLKPSETYAGTYKTTITWDIQTSGPTL